MKFWKFIAKMVNRNGVKRTFELTALTFGLCSILFGSSVGYAQASGDFSFLKSSGAVRSIGMGDIHVAGNEGSEFLRLNPAEATEYGKDHLGFSYAILPTVGNTD